MAETLPRSVKVAAVQAEPAWNDLQGGVAKTISLIKQAASEGANVLGMRCYAKAVSKLSLKQYLRFPRGVHTGLSVVS